jgi:hypothetical protein
MGARSQGHPRSITDSITLWAYTRAQIYPPAGAKSIVLVGTSRIHLGVNPDVLEQKLPGYTVTQLAIDGAPGLATLQDLADDPAFDGLVVFDASVLTLVLSRAAAQRPLVDYYHREWSHLGRLNKIANLWVQMFLQERFAILGPGLLGPRQVKLFTHGTPYYIVTEPDRARTGHYYTMLSPAELDQLHAEGLARAARRIRNFAPIDQAEFLDSLRMHVRPAVAKLQQRGGNVIFVYFPYDAANAALFDAAFPRARYWDQIQPIVGAPTLHFQDVPGMRDLRIGEGSHLEVNEAQRFTARLADELLRLKLVRID